ncbi:MAG: winged helix-turn-helix domain-containing protein, partial [Victivallaceae bacterium]
MKLKNNPHSDATYPIIADKIIRKIKSGEYRLGEKLSARTIAAELKIGRRIASSALDALVLNGVVTVEPRKGFFVSEKFALRNKSRIGIFICEMTPLISGIMLNKTFHECLRRDYELIYGSDWDQRDTMKDFLKRNSDISGLLIHGFVEEYALKPLKKWGKPYLVMGCHNISAEHPSEEANLLEDMSLTLTKAFSKFPGKRIAGMLGDRDSASDCKIMQALRIAV